MAENNLRLTQETLGNFEQISEPDTTNVNGEVSQWGQYALLPIPLG